MNAIAKLTAFLLAAAVCAALPAQAQTDTSTNAPTPRRARASTRYSGQIASIDSTNMIVTLKATARRPETKVKVTSSTKIKKEGEPAEFADAVADLYVSGSGKKDTNGVWTATTMNITTKRPGRAKAPAAKPPSTSQ